MLFLYGLLALFEILSVVGMQLAVVGYMLDHFGIYQTSGTRVVTIAIVSLATFVVVRVLVSALENRNKNEVVGKAGIPKSRRQPRRWFF
jgi:hypothetical protein